MKVILVSGTPGTGKTTYSKILSKEKGYIFVDVNKVIELNSLKSGYDKKRNTYIIDTAKLNKALIKLINDEKKKKTKGLVIDSHLSHYLPKKHADFCVITKCDLKTLKKRLVKRGYSKEKIRENLDAEIFDTCRVEALELGHKVKVIITSNQRP